MAKQKNKNIPKGKYINPLTDFGFTCAAPSASKRIFGDGAFLKDFLNSVLELNDKIVSLRYENVEYPGRVEESRSARFDLHCRTNKGEYIIVEVQNCPQPYFTNRLLYYSTFPVQKQAKKGKWNFELKKVFSVSILNFSISEEDEYFVHKALLYDITAKRVFNENLVFACIELTDFNKLENELETDLDCWLYLLKHLPEMEEAPEKITNKKLLKKVITEAEIAKLTPEELDLYDKSLKYYRTMTHNEILKEFQKINAKLTKDLAKKDKNVEALTQNNEALTQNNEALIQNVESLTEANAALQKQVAEYQRKYGALNVASAQKTANRRTKSRKTAIAM